MKYTLYQITKYFLILIVIFVLVIYLGKTQKLPKFLPDDVRNSIVDFSDYVLSYETFRVVYSPIERGIEFLADDGYSYKYRVLPQSIIDRLNNEVESMNNSLNLFLNNPLFETWILPNLVSSSAIIKDTFKNYFSEDFYLGFVIYSSKMIDVFSLGVPREENFRGVVYDNGISFYGKNMVFVRRLSKDIDFLDGFFVLVIDKEKFFDYILNHDKNSFEIVYIVHKDRVVYSTKNVPEEYLLKSLHLDVISILGGSYKQKVLTYNNVKIGFVFPNPTWVRWIYIVLKILVLLGFLVGLFFINRSIVMKLKKSEEIKRKLISDLKNSIGSKSDLSFNNLLVKTTEENLKFFDKFVEQDIKTTKTTKKMSIFR